MTTEEKAVKQAELHFKMLCNYTSPEELIKRAYRAGYLAGATEALASQWVSVKERLPEEGQEVLLYDVNSIRHYVIGWRRKKGDNKSMWTLSNGFVADKDITHWIPIPPLKGDPDTFDETDK